MTTRLKPGTRITTLSGITGTIARRIRSIEPGGLTTYALDNGARVRAIDIAIVG